MNKKLRVLELFSGLGACSKALERLGIDFEIVDSVEIDKYAVQSFNAIHGTNFEPQDITKWDKDIECDLVMHGSPCQDFSVAGLGKGGDEGSGTRSSLMYETIRIVDKLKPKYVIWENVKNLLSKKHRHNFDAYLETMEKLGYKNFYQVLNAKDFGVPQNRERVFTISIRDDNDNPTFEFPEGEPLQIRLKDVLEKNVDENFYLTDEQIKRIKITTYNSGSEKIRIQNTEGVARTLCARDYKDPKCVQVAQMYGGGKEKNPQAGRIYDSNGISPTMDTCSGGNRMPKVIEHNKDPKHQQDLVQDEEGLCRTIPAGTHGSTPHLLKTVVREPKIEFVGGVGDTDRIGDGKELSRNFPSGNRIYSTEGIATTQTSEGGGLGGATGLYMVGDNEKVISETPAIIQKQGDRGTNNYSVSDTAYTIPANPMSDRGQMLVEPQPIKRRRSEYGKEIRKSYENHELGHSEAMKESYVAEDGIMPTLTASKREQKIAEPFIVASRARPFYGHRNNRCGSTQVR